MFELGETDEPGGQHFGPEHIGLMRIGGVAEVSAGAHKPASALPPPSGHFVALRGALYQSRVACWPEIRGGVHLREVVLAVLCALQARFSVSCRAIMGLTSLDLIRLAHAAPTIALFWEQS